MRGKRSTSVNPLGILAAFIVAVALVLSLPILGVVSVVARVTLLAAAFLAAVGGLVLYRTSPNFRSWFTAKLDDQPEYKGLRLRDGVALVDGHSWLRSESQRAILGADDLAQRVLGPVDVIELPEPGHRIELGEPFMTLRHGSRQLSLRAPLSGTVVRRNIALLAEPKTLNSDPYGRGWAVEIREETPPHRSEMHVGAGARAWFQDEVDRLIESIQPISQYGPAMADGGTLVPDLYRALDDACWRRVRTEFFDIQLNEG